MPKSLIHVGAIVAVGALLLNNPPAFGRKWSDNTGKHAVEAEFVKVKDEKAVLKKPDGGTISVPLVRLSDADREYIDEHWEKGPQNWSVTDGHVTVLEQQAYVAYYGTSKWIVLKPDDHNWVLVSFNVKALSEDPKAIEKLSDRRKMLYEKISSEALAGSMAKGSVLLKEEDQKELTGKYRLLDLEQMRLTDSTGDKQTSLWCHDPAPAFSMFGSLGNLEGYQRGADPPGCAATIKAANTFLGLIEVGDTLPVSLLFVIPKSLELEGLTMRVAGSDPLTLEVGETK